MAFIITAIGTGISIISKITNTEKDTAFVVFIVSMIATAFGAVASILSWIATSWGLMHDITYALAPISLGVAAAATLVAYRNWQSMT